MARVRSTTFVGSPPRDVVADASIFNRWMTAAVGDVALVTDLVTGANATTPITHTGAGNGCQLRLPLAAQHIDRSLVLEGDGTIAEQPFYIVAVPVFVPAGEAGAYRLNVTAPTARGNTTVMFAEVRDSAWALNLGPVAGVYDEEGATAVTQNGPVRDTARWSITLGVGLQYVLVKRACRFADADPFARLVSWALEHDRTYAGEGNGLSITGSAAVGSPYPAPSTFTPSTVHDTYDEEIGVGAPLSAYVLTRLNRHINALWEYVTGSLIPGNATYQNATTWDNNRAGFTAEGLLDLPIAVVALGSAVADVAKPSLDYTTLTPPNGLLDWHVHPTTRTTTWGNVSTVTAVLPSFSASSSTLKCAILVNSPSGVANAAQWRFRCTTSAGSATAVAGVQIGTSTLLLATVVAIPFTPSAQNDINIEISNTATGALGAETLDVLGFCLYFDP